MHTAVGLLLHLRVDHAAVSVHPRYPTGFPIALIALIQNASFQHIGDSFKLLMRIAGKARDIVVRVVAEEDISKGQDATPHFGIGPERALAWRQRCFQWLRGINRVIA